MTPHTQNGRKSIFRFPAIETVYTFVCIRYFSIDSLTCLIIATGNPLATYDLIVSCSCTMSQCVYDLHCTICPNRFTIKRFVYLCHHKTSSISLISPPATLNTLFNYLSAPMYCLHHRLKREPGIASTGSQLITSLPVTSDQPLCSLLHQWKDQKSELPCL